MKVLIGNLLDSKAQTLVNTVNCVGIMGKGIALQFKKQFPDMFDDYAKRCTYKQVKLGEPYLYRSLMGPWILNFPTKDHWRSLTRLEDIERGLEYLEAHYREWGITSIAVPPLGCGNGQLEWRVVGPTLYRYLRRFEIPVELYAPVGTPSEQLNESYLGYAPRRNYSGPNESDPEWIKPGWVALAEVVGRLHEDPGHWPVGRTVFQKIAYVATTLGIPTGMTFRRGAYGPFSGQLSSVESRLQRNGLIEEEGSLSRLQVKPGRTLQDARRSYGDELKQWDREINRTVDLFMRVRTSMQAETVATVMFAANELNQDGHQPSDWDVIHTILGWKKSRIRIDDITKAIDFLSGQGWIDVRITPRAAQVERP